jgi:hypothetical protein
VSKIADNGERFSRGRDAELKVDDRVAISRGCDHKGDRFANRGRFSRNPLYIEVYRLQTGQSLV